MRLYWLRTLVAMCAIPGALLAVSARAGDLLWGINGHPLVSYPGVTLEQQIGLISKLKAKSYRVDVTRTASMNTLAVLLRMAKAQGITILPVLIPPVNLDRESPADLRLKSAQYAEAYARRFPQIEVWELGNELENYAIIRPCEMRDDGTKYPCEWGLAGGVGVLDYYGPRYAKVAAVLAGLAEGVHAANPKARRAIGSAGWGHLGIFERLQRDGVPWEITVWHWSADELEWALKHLVRYGKPIWITEVSHPYGSKRDGEEGQARGLAEKIAQLRKLAPLYNVEAAYVYELLDETYWAPNFEAFMGLVRLDRAPNGASWAVGAPKAAFYAYRDAIAPREALSRQGDR